MNEVPESLCFGLLQHYDIAQLSALILPRSVVFHDASERVVRDVEPALQRLRQ